MPLHQNAPARDRYIVRATKEPAALAAFIDSIQDDPDIELVDTIGPAGQPHTAVVEVATDKALHFERRFIQSAELTIERDQPLSLFDQLRSVSH